MSPVRSLGSLRPVRIVRDDRPVATIRPARPPNPVLAIRTDRPVRRDMATPVGQLTLVAHDEALVYVGWESQTQWPKAQKHPIMDLAEVQIQEYFAGQRQEFDLPLSFVGTEFQLQVWQTLMEIPYGSTTSYAKQAQRLGRAKAVRAVGSANGKNPLAIVIPCHRVVATGGGLGGFGGGLKNKQILLDLERQFSRADGPLQFQLG